MNFILRIIRKNDSFGRYDDIDVYVNGKKKGGVKYDSVQDFEIKKAGQYTIYVKQASMKSKPITIGFRSKHQRIISYEIGVPSVGNPFQLLRTLFFDRDSGFYLREKSDRRVSSIKLRNDDDDD